MDEEHKRRILAESRALLDGTWRAEDFPRPTPQPSAPVGKSEPAGELVYKELGNAQILPPEPRVETRAGDDWNEWLHREIDRRLEQEQEFYTELIGEVVARLRSEMRGEQAAETAAELARIWTAICETKKMLVDITRERVAEGLRNIPAGSSRVN